MTTQQAALPVADPTGPESEIIRNFLRASAAYLFSCAYRDSLRAAYVRHAAMAPIGIAGVAELADGTTVTRL